MNISVIFATYKRPQILSQTLSSFTELRTKGLIWELLVVDNGGDTFTKNIITEYCDKLPLRFIVERKPGKNNALNHAIKKARGDLFIFTDDDVIVDPHWLNEIWDGAKRWPKFSVFGGRILPKYPSGRKPLYENHRFIRDAYVIADWDLPEGPYNASKVWGPNMAVRARLFRSGWAFNPYIGPNGKNYVMGSETEFNIRLEKAGFSPVYLPNSLVYHQIRPEQLKIKWLYGRAFREGRRQAKEEIITDIQTVFGIPRYYLRNLIIFGLKRLLFFFRRKTAFHFAIKYWKVRGMIYQYRKDFFKEGK